MRYTVLYLSVRSVTGSPDDTGRPRRGRPRRGPGAAERRAGPDAIGDTGGQRHGNRTAIDTVGFITVIVGGGSLGFATSGR